MRLHRNVIGFAMAGAMLLCGAPPLARATQLGPIVCDLNGRTEVFDGAAVVPLQEGVTRCRYQESGRLERVVLVDSARELARIEYNPAGQVRQLRCASRSRLAEDISLCGWVRPMEIDLFDNAGLRRASVLHADGQRIGYKTYFPGGGLDTEELRRPDGLVELRRHHAEGGVRSIVMMQNEKRRSEQEFGRGGQLLRDSRWDEFQQRVQTDWNEAGRVQRRVTQSLYEGRPVVAVEEYWPSGLLRERSTRDANDQPIGLMQKFDEAGRLSEEVLMTKGQAQVLYRRDEAAGATAPDPPQAGKVR